jgi:acyl dehydratase
MSGAGDVPPASAELLGYLAGLVGRPAHRPAVARDAVTASAIRTWCDAMGERDPRYLDVDAARAAGHDDLIAPAATLHMWTMPGLEADRPLTAGPAREGDLDEAVRARLTQDGYTGTLAASTDQEFLGDIRLGDVLVAEDEYTSVSQEKTTHLGPGFFLTTRLTYRTIGGRLVGALSTAVFHFAPQSVAVLADPLPAPCDLPPRPVSAPPVELTVGVECGPVVIPVTPTQIISGALATRDFYPVHHDRDFARAHGNRDFLMNSLTTNGLLARVVREWSGGGRLLRMRTRIVSPAYAHDELTVTGTVSGIGPDWTEILLRAALQQGLHAEVVAQVRRPAPL